MARRPAGAIHREPAGARARPDAAVVRGVRSCRDSLIQVRTDTDWCLWRNVNGIAGKKVGFPSDLISAQKNGLRVILRRIMLEDPGFLVNDKSVGNLCLVGQSGSAGR